MGYTEQAEAAVERMYVAQQKMALVLAGLDAVLTEGADDFEALCGINLTLKEIARDVVPLDCHNDLVPILARYLEEADTKAA